MLEQKGGERRRCVEGSAAVKAQKEKYIHCFDCKLQYMPVCVRLRVCMGVLMFKGEFYCS